MRTSGLGRWPSSSVVTSGTGSEPGSKPPHVLTPGGFLQVELKSQEAQSLQQQRDQYLSHLQQHVAACQQLVAEKEMLHKQGLLQTQLIDQLQHEESQGKVQADMLRQELQEAQVRDLRAGLGPEWEDLQPVSFLIFFPGPLGAPESCHPAEPEAAGPAEPDGVAWGR